jgi:hypothetical protein
MTTKKKGKDSNPHVSIRIPLKLRDDINDYAKRHNTTVSVLTRSYYEQLLAADGPQDAEQI